jgi:V-type H+-transporting ATPase subunit a
MGHGFLLLLIGLIFVIYNDSFKNGDLAPIAQGRWLILLMGVFAIYNGTIYNEFLSLPIEPFTSCYSKTPYMVNPTDPDSTW